MRQFMLCMYVYYTQYKKYFEPSITWQFTQQIHGIIYLKLALHWRKEEEKKPLLTERCKSYMIFTWRENIP